jgi:hypothetical protein
MQWGVSAALEMIISSTSPPPPRHRHLLEHCTLVSLLRHDCHHQTPANIDNHSVHARRCGWMRHDRRPDNVRAIHALHYQLDHLPPLCPLLNLLQQQHHPKLLRSEPHLLADVGLRRTRGRWCGSSAAADSNGVQITWPSTVMTSRG